MEVLDLQVRLKVLQKTEFEEMSSFGALSKEFVKSLLTAGEILRFSKEEMIFPAGDRADCFYIVLQGSVALFACSSEVKRPIAKVDVGQSFGFASMIGLRSRSYEAQSDGQCTVLQISSSTFGSLYEANPKEFPVFFINLSRDMSRFMAHLAEKSS